MEKLVHISRREFSEIPRQARHSPARTHNVQVRFYVDRYVEHEEAFSFLADSKQTHGEGPKTLIRALLHYRDSVVIPVAQGSIPEDRVPLYHLDFEPKKPGDADRTKAVSIRVHIDKISEHREVYDFLQRQQKLYGDGNRTVIKALLHYKQSVIDPLEAA